ncbi:MAG: hypothetical protein CBC62_10640 [Opitutia bacterium TMED102]|nr:hypothetical protein [Verrucomicrobiales bacterium]OUV34896.1 MAG: hypothetical protein CBC62_10640 [Opitutae bacterium TMED102]
MGFSQTCWKKEGAFLSPDFGNRVFGDRNFPEPFAAKPLGQPVWAQKKRPIFGPFSFGKL